ncbi:MAG TPA: hypothetical protein VKU86_09350 [Acidimicrobiales bacterium]|nr:hypothetical protein [Acidimicrobiales bacterium]
MSVPAGAWVDAAAVVVTALVGAAAGGMRTWARRVEAKIDHAQGQTNERIDLVTTAVGKLDDELSRVRERLTAAETALRFTTGVMVTGSAPWHARRRDDPGRELFDPGEGDRA